MRNPLRTTALIAVAALVVWQGVVVAIPHNHADHGVSQEELLCSASHPSSQTSHLHASGRALAPHPCLACLAGPTIAGAIGFAEIAGAATGGSAGSTADPDLWSRLRTHLPLMRGPPLAT